MSDPVDPRITAYLDEQGLTPSVTKVVPLTGDASDRRYFRVRLADGDPIVLSLHAGPIDFAALPFVLVARLLRAIPLPAPAILHHSDALGILGLQDLGDVTLQAHLGVASRAEHAALYRQAVGFIATLQQRGRDLASNEYPPFGIAFDVEKLTWELEFFVKHYVMAYRGAGLTEAIRAALREEWAGIAEELAAEPRVLCHRDYHSRNLMLHEGALHIIDFQDARMGPDTYDLVSLLRDSYVDLTPAQVDELVAYFLALTRGPQGAGPADVAEFRRRFDLMALQRNLKALGTFGYQTTSRRNPVYIQYMPRTLSYVGANLGASPRFGRLRELLAGPIAELR
ncbi:MAG: phosphotransferase [Acidobacteria bacterium]|nr:phosphotransferase [Acidobacteriota bacterium]